MCAWIVHVSPGQICLPSLQHRYFECVQSFPFCYLSATEQFLIGEAVSHSLTGLNSHSHQDISHRYPGLWIPLTRIFISLCPFPTSSRGRTRKFLKNASCWSLAVSAHVFLPLEDLAKGGVLKGQRRTPQWQKGSNTVNKLILDSHQMSLALFSVTVMLVSLPIHVMA